MLSTPASAAAGSIDLEQGIFSAFETRKVTWEIVGNVAKTSISTKSVRRVFKRGLIFVLRLISFTCHGVHCTVKLLIQIKFFILRTHPQLITLFFLTGLYMVYFVPHDKTADSHNLHLEKMLRYYLSSSVLD